ncbi:hypothetical protein EDB84DRAFT_1434058 [Lactarius hengduanensis]|nr:hypothetical protein EDB84DRAFT_1434058 [Lactarius hengduanensis]
MFPLTYGHETLLLPHREDGELAECQLISIFRFTAFPSDTTTPPSMFCLPTFPPGDGPQSPQVMHTVPTHHPIRATLTRCLVAKPGHTPSLKKVQKIFVVPHWCKFRSVYWTNPLFVGVKSPSPSPSLTGHSRLGATERRSVTPPPPSPSEDHYASPLLPSLRSCSGYSPPYWWSTLIPTPLGWSGRARGRRGRAGVAGLCSFQDVMGYSIRYRYRGYFLTSPKLLPSDALHDYMERCSVTPPPPSPSEDHYASPLLPLLRSCSGVSCVGMPLVPAQTSLGLNSLWLVLLPLAGNFGSRKRKAGQGGSGRPMSLAGREGIFHSLSVLRILPDLSQVTPIQPYTTAAYEELVKSTSASKAPENKTLRLEAASDRVRDSRTVNVTE